MAECPACGHNVLTHRVGVCQAIVTVRGGSKREPNRAHCGCTATLPPGTIEQAQLELEDLFRPDDEDEP